MPVVDVPLSAPTYRNIDLTMARDNAARLIDGFLDEEGNINTRPGLLESFSLTNFSKSVDGLFWWDPVGILIAVGAGRIWRINQDLSQTNLSSEAFEILSGKRPTFAHNGTTLFVANGSRIAYTNGADAVAFITDADTPVTVSHIIFLDNYLIVNSVGSSRFYWSEIEDFSTWSALDFASAGGDPDIVVAIHTFRKEIYVFGRKSVEIWQNDGQTPFSRVEGGFIDTGCIAPYSIVKSDNGIMWLSDNKKFVVYGGGDVQEISTPYDREITNFGVVSDCVADRIDIMGHTFYKFQFPSQQRTLIFNATAKNWEEWGYWNGGGSFYEPWLGNCHVFSPTMNRHFVGSRKADGRVYTMSPDHLTDGGNPIRMMRQTGHINYGSNFQKRNNSFTMRAKRGSISGSDEPKMVMRVKDDNRDWSNEIQLSLGKMGETYNIIKKNRLGVYRTRQYEFVVSDNVGVAFGDAKEDVFVSAR